MLNIDDYIFISALNNALFIIAYIIIIKVKLSWINYSEMLALYAKKLIY